MALDKNTGGCAILNLLILKNMSAMSNQRISIHGMREARNKVVKVSRPAGVPLSNRVGPIVIVLLRKEVGGESGLKKLFQL